MGIEDLALRLNDNQYKNWLKAGRCLLLLKDGLHPVIAQQMKAFHGDLLNQNNVLRRPCTASCRLRGAKLSPLCPACSVWQEVILKHHRQREAVTVNWSNCYPPNWRTDYWELAKAYMPRGQGEVNAANKCDASALLNLINYCDCFQAVDLKHVREVIRYRNELMHSGEFRVTDEWMSHYKTTLTNLVHQFRHVPQMVAVSRQIKEMLTADLSISVSGLDQMDFADLDRVESDSLSQSQISADLIGQWEAELLHESLHELLRAAGDDDDTKTQDTEHLRRLGGFLQANRDLAERFSSELEAINAVEPRE